MSGILPESLSVTGADELGWSDWLGRGLLLVSPVIFSGKTSRGAIGRIFFAGFKALQNAHLNAEYSYSSCDTIPIEIYGGNYLLTNFCTKHGFYDFLMIFSYY